MQDQIFRRPQVEAVTGKSRSGIYADMAAGTFPKPVRIGRKAVGWPSSVIQQWIDARKAEAA